MRETSSTFIKENPIQPKDPQGGEKKVMKKSLSAILAASMAFSMFASVAFGAEKTAQEKFDELKAEGFFTGYADGTAGLDKEMTRAEFTAVIARMMGLEEKASANDFNDVAAGHWAAGYIGAVKEAGVINGVGNDNFDPEGKVTVEQMAKILVEAAGLTVDNTATVEGATEWAAPYVKAAVAAGFIAEQSNYAVNATRDILVTASYAAADKLAPTPDKVSVTEAKATGVYTVEVKFNKEVDTAKAVVTLKKGTSTVTTTPTWSDDKKSVSLKTGARITAGEYTVSVTGLDAATVDVTSAKFTAEDEKVSKIDFVNSNDTLAYSKSVAIKVKAVNQYGETVSTGTSNFTALVSGKAPATFKKQDDGSFLITADVVTDKSVSQGNGIVPVTVYMNNSPVSVSKNFKVGTVPILTKIESTGVTYSNANNALTNGDDTASIALTMLDQYGNEIVKKQFTDKEINANNLNPVITPYEEEIKVEKADPDGSLAAEDIFDDNDKPRIKIKLTKKIDKTADYTVNIYGGTSSASAVIKVSAAAVPTKVEFEPSDITIASNDDDVFIPIVAYDANGNKLSIEDVVDGVARFKFDSSAGVASLQETGKHKGKVKIDFTGETLSAGSRISVTGQIKDSQTNTFVQSFFDVQDPRYPDQINVKNEAEKKGLPGSSDDVEFQLVDNYGKNLDDIETVVRDRNGESYNHQVKVKVTTSGTGVTVAAKNAAVEALKNVISATESEYVVPANLFKEFNAGFKFSVAENAVDTGKATIKATVERKKTSDTSFNEQASVSRSFESVKADAKLTYSIKTIGDLFAAKDKLGDDAGAAASSPYDKKISVVAKDEGGTTVKLRNNAVKGVSADANVITTAISGNDGYILGNKAGTTTVTAVVYTNKGDTVSFSQSVTVKADSITVASMEAGKSDNTYDPANLLNAYDYFTDGEDGLTVKDNYGVSYENQAIVDAYKGLGVVFTAKRTNGTGTVYVDPQTGVLTVNGDVREFVLTATAPNGQSLSVVVTK
ncbi:S-layer homology domain-containing protein [Paenibacillus turpanensis]|uniref:S-layer homology domain-containing protein n=1 Tax=Paenibacillus turpanensis TaxID=2689078 RepID=UPI00140A6B8C|nr:S-layer homology domain-containing protein [Paenibacillus turpanensis]